MAETEDKRLIVGDKEPRQFFVICLTCVATIGGFLFGYDTGIISGSMLLIRDVYSLSTPWQQLIVSGTIVTASVFSLVAGITSDMFGRKITIMWSCVVFTLGAVVMGVSPDKEVLFVGRLVVGIGIGFASMSVPVYVAEAAPPTIRGALVTLNQLFITIGILVSSIIAGAFSTDKENGWRYMLGLAGIPSVIQFIGFFFLPESPRWLLSKGRDEDARKSLMKIRETVDVDTEFNQIKESLENESSQQQGNVCVTLGLIFKSQPVRRALAIGCLLQFFQQLCGINTVIYYSASILRMAGFPSQQAIWLVCVPNAVNMLCTFIGIYLVEKSGRKILTLISFVGVIIALVVLAVGFQLSVINTPDIFVTEASNDTKCSAITQCNTCITDKDCGFCFEKGNVSSGSCLPTMEKHTERYANPEFSTLFRCNETNYNMDSPEYTWADNFCPTDYAWMAILGLALFVIGFAPGLGPMPWTINSEIYPTWARGTCISIATAVNWIANLIVSMTFLSLLEAITTYGTFYLFAGISLVGLISIGCILPETKNKTLEEVHELFMSEEYKAQHHAPRLYATDNLAFEEKNSKL
ncbi:proton myo-inositol cotransporter-like isoform X2 [Mizuhopecten yessoensis]|uniref:proton myo-inositol cotransporter-like isoform X2 n=1 Tax=Mizuhopecten yessoensis TaxID=6573 RepID=UPI000B458DEF|nr:proton myo-inositol cotransporter-like isoform X2 [Mizuhopecten yessoensis]